MRTPFIFMLVAALAAGGLPPRGEASPPVLELRPADRRLDDEGIAALGGLLRDLERAWALGGPDSLWPRLDAGRGGQLWHVLHTDSLRYGDALRPALADTGRYRDFQEAVWRGLAPRLHGLMDFAPRRASLVRAGDGTSRLVFLGEERRLARVENRERHAGTPYLAEILVLSLLTPLAWEDPIFAPWRRAEAAHPSLAWSGFCPAAAAGLPRFEAGMDETAVDARLDSLFRHDPQLSRLGWLKRRFVRRSMETALGEILLLEAAWEEYRRQAAGGGGPGAPPCPLIGRATLRLVLLREHSFGSRWRLALCLPSGVQDASPYTFFLEPGAADWLERFRRWREERS